MADMRPVLVYVREGETGVKLIVGNPDDPEIRTYVLTLSPEYARKLAQNLTLTSWKVEEAGEENVGGGG